MSTTLAESRELVISRLIDAPRETVYNAFITPELLSQWWVPRPWSVAELTMEPRPGGVFNTTMADPEGKLYPNEGIFLEIVPNERIVFSDVFTAGWEPNPDPFMVAIITLEDEEGKTRYTARVRHWTVEAKEKHEGMGFYEGWGLGLDQLAELVAK